MGLGKTIAMPVAAVTDIEQARDFYGKVLGLREANLEEGAEEEEGVILYEVNDGNYLLVYQRPTPANSAATVVAFAVEDVDATVNALRASGVKFEDYDLPELNIKTTDGIASDEGGHKVAWFKDPAGNILAVENSLPRLGRRRDVGTYRPEQEGVHA